MIKNIKVKNRKELQKYINWYRNAGYKVITYSLSLVELEKDNKLVVIEK